MFRIGRGIIINDTVLRQGAAVKFTSILYDLLAGFAVCVCCRVLAVRRRGCHRWRTAMPSGAQFGALVHEADSCQCEDHCSSQD